MIVCAILKVFKALWLEGLTGVEASGMADKQGQDIDI